MHSAIELILPVSVHQLTQKLLTVTLLPELFRELSVELTQMKAELWLLRGFNQAEALACCTVMASIASTADGDVDSRGSHSLSLAPIVPVTVSGNKTRLWGNTLRQNVINLVGKQTCLPYRNGCQLDSCLHVIYTGVTRM